MKDISNRILSPKILNLLTEIERFQGAWQNTSEFKPAIINNLKKTTVITSAGASTRIEGAILTDEEVQQLINKNCKITRLSSRSEREVAGYIKALNYIYDNYEKLPISEKTIREIHQLLTSELSESQLPQKQRGIYKDISNNVVEIDHKTGQTKIWFKTTPPGPQTESQMFNLVNDFKNLVRKKELPNIILLGIFIVKFLAIHPFRDGNGRISRLLTIWLMLKFGYTWFWYYSHEKIIEDTKEKYYVALRKTQNTLNEENPDYTTWLSYFLETIKAQTDILKQELGKASPISQMNENEKKVYQIIKEHDTCNISFINHSVSMTRNGLKTLLRRLVDKGIIIKTGKGKNTVYKIN